MDVKEKAVEKKTTEGIQVKSRMKGSIEMDNKRKEMVMAEKPRKLKSFATRNVS